ncbi:PDZ domain-containing protein [Rubinisphaera margarita]|uniref:PDZ domain-containing protein n=1 Tax=Rubinisphaera margarita TaxID=2909586 RepID=UPI001EE8AC33|nr:PDZ domain-containing protein [Rubinisphaera margarita]MCG6157033.1 PDZ domain-containing protein [Rubinisphaera margarita]
MSIDSSPDFYSEAVVRRETSAKSRSAFWLMTAAITFLIGALGTIFYIPIGLQQAFLTELRADGVMIATYPRESTWTGIAREIERHTGFSPPVMQAIQRISFGTRPVAPETLESLPDFPEIRGLSFSGSDVTEDDLTKLIGDLPNLADLHLFACPNLSSEWIRELREANSHMSLTYRGTAYLGIAAATEESAPNSRCQVVHVERGTAAEQAGLRVDDNIVRIDDVPVDSFSDLVMELSGYQPGDKVEIHVVRDNDTLVLNCELGAWKMYSN